MKVKNALAAFAAIYVCLTVAGLVATLAPRWSLARPLALVMFAALLTLYALKTAVGQQTRSRVYLAMALLCPLAIALLGFAGLALIPSYEVSVLVELLASGFAVGFEVAGTPGVPVWLSFLLWWLSVTLAAIVAVAIRDRLGRRVAP